MKFSQILNEMPRKIGSLIGSPRREEFLKNIIQKISEIKIQPKNYGKYKYIISENDNLFVLYKDSEIQGFISFVITGRKFQVLNIENILKINGFSIICFQIILKSYYKEILTGDLLSNENIRAHKKFLDIFKMYHEDEQIESTQEIDNIIKQDNKKTQFIIKENFSNILEFHNKNYGFTELTEPDLLDEYIQL